MKERPNKWVEQKREKRRPRARERGEERGVPALNQLLPDIESNVALRKPSVRIGEEKERKRVIDFLQSKGSFHSEFVVVGSKERIETADGKSGFEEVLDPLLIALEEIDYFGPGLFNDLIVGIQQLL